MDFRVAPQAESDLDEIWHFLATQAVTSTSLTA
jgi:plasmid stabilization system protein ParE